MCWIQSDVADSCNIEQTKGVFHKNSNIYATSN